MLYLTSKLHKLATARQPRIIALQQALNAVIQEVESITDLSTVERYNLALRKVKARRLKGLTKLFRDTIPEPQVPDSPESKQQFESRLQKFESISTVPRLSELLDTELDMEEVQEQLAEICNKMDSIGKRFESIESRCDTIEGTVQQARDVTQATNAQSAVIQTGFESVTTNLSTRNNDSNLGKIRPYNNDKDDFMLFYILFKDRVTKSNWTNDRAKTELLSSLQTPTCTRIIKTRKISLWTWNTLLDECKDRLCKKLSQAQLETELYELESIESEDPDICMGRVEEVIGKADQNEISDEIRNMLQATTFLRLIHVNQRMYYYIKDKSTTLNEPYTLLRHSKDYLRTRGHEDAHTMALVQKELKKAGIEPKKEDTAEASANTDSTTKSTTKESTDTKAVPAVVAEMKARIEELSKQLDTEATVDARFLSTKAKTTDWYEKLSSGHNEHERTLRGVKSDIQDIKSSIKAISKAVDKSKPYKQTTFSKSKPTFDKKDDKSKSYKKNGKDFKGRGRGRGRGNYRSPVVFNYYGADYDEGSEEDTDSAETEAEDEKADE